MNDLPLKAFGYQRMLARAARLMDSDVIALLP